MRRLTGREIVVPASIGNVGPGFDTLGLAVSLYLRVRVREASTDGAGRLECRFREDAPRGENRIARAFAASRSGRQAGVSLVVDVSSRIPQRAGLGSSAAATIAGLKLRDLVDGRRSRDELIAAACGLEGHPDNVAAALFGGLTASCVLPAGRVEVTRWVWPQAWRLVVATPHVQLSTSASRRVLPARLPLASAVFNLQRVGRLLAAIRDRNGNALREALRDQCHQDYRSPLVPLLRDVLEMEHPDLLGVCLSGAGPSIVAVARGNVRGVARAMAAVYQRGRVPCTIRMLTVHQERTS